MTFFTAVYANFEVDDEYKQNVLSFYLFIDDDIFFTEFNFSFIEFIFIIDHDNTNKFLLLNLILKWMACQCVNYVSYLKLPQYSENFLNRAF